MVEIPKLPECVDNTVKNLADKPSQAIGQTISDLWNLVLGSRVAFAAEKKKIKYAHDLEEFRKELDKNVYAIPEDKLVEPPMQIAAQSLVDSQYCIDSKEIREMFANLIARSMHADYSSQVHPSFSKIVQQLSPLDAQLLSIMKKWQRYGGVAVADYRKADDNAGYQPLIECVPAVMPEHCAPEAAARSLITLRNLGLVDIPYDLHFSDSSRYEVFTKIPLYEVLKIESAAHGRRLEVKGRLATLTIIGIDFVSVCLD